MTIPPANDPLFQALRRLPPAVPDAARDARAQSRCHAALAERRRGPSYRLRGRARRRLESAIVGAFGVVYLLAIFRAAARILTQGP
jgi:hypothetical protein